MKKGLLVCMIGCLMSGMLLAQEDTFTVLLNKGKNELGKPGHLQSVLVGSKVLSEEIVKVSEGGYVALVHNASGKSLELTKKGDYTISMLQQGLNDQSSSVMAKYGMFLMEKLNPQDEGSQNLNVTGAVERGADGLIVISLPKVVDVYGNQAFISWQKLDNIQEYIVTYKDKLDGVISEKTVIGNSFIMDLNQESLQNEKIIIFNVRAKTNDSFRSPDFGFKRLSLDDKSAIDIELADLKKVYKSEKLMDQLLLASFFEQNELLADAITCYNQASLSAKGTDGFDTMYQRFMDRNGLQGK